MKYSKDGQKFTMLNTMQKTARLYEVWIMIHFFLNNPLNTMEKRYMIFFFGENRREVKSRSLLNTEIKKCFRISMRGCVRPSVRPSVTLHFNF